MQQNLTITYMKATGIILMVLAHCSNFELLYRIVYSFHMPLFFIVSGYCFKEKYFDKPGTFIWRRVKGLWWPYVKWGLLFIALHNFFYHLNIYNDGYDYNGLYTTKDYLNRIIGTFLLTQREPLLVSNWFLSSLFWGSIIAFCALYCSHKLTGMIKCNKCSQLYIDALWGGILLAICVVTNYYKRTFSILYIGPRDFMAATFFVIGCCLAKGKMRKFCWWQSFCAFGIMIVNSYYNLISVHQLLYAPMKVVPYMITAVMGTWCIYSLPWDKLKGLLARFFEYIGNHTLSILVWHFLCFKIVSLIIIKLNELPIERLAETPVIIEYANRGWFVLSTIVGVGMPLVISYGYKKLKEHNRGSHLL